jgi:predicted HD phosphohydrolase
MISPLESTRDLLALLATGAGADDGETVDLLEHSLQCAALLADAAPDDRELQVAGLVHDIGTLLEPGKPESHAATGAAAIALLLGTRVADLVARHDEAKRYLVTVEPRYREVLSERSIETLREQGGLLDPRERAAFEAHPCFSDLLSLRRADDAAKVAGREVPGVNTWRPIVDTVAARVRV